MVGGAAFQRHDGVALGHVEARRAARLGAFAHIDQRFTRLAVNRLSNSTPLYLIAGS